MGINEVQNKCDIYANSKGSTTKDSHPPFDADIVNYIAMSNSIVEDDQEYVQGIDEILSLFDHRFDVPTFVETMHDVEFTEGIFVVEHPRKSDIRKFNSISRE